MTITVIDENEGHRINHPVYRDVYNVTYKEAVITDIEMVQVGNGWDLTDRCKIDDEDEWLPIFYHCKLHCYKDETTDLKDNDALTDGSFAFEVGHEVKVLLEKDKPKYIVGHYDNEPKMCVDIFKMTFTGWEGDSYFIYYQGSTQEEYGGLNQEPKDYYGNIPVCDQEGYVLFGQRTFQVGTIQNYWGDFYVKVGPVFYIIRVKSVGMPAPATGDITTFKAVWTQELENECKQRGADAESTIPTGIFGSWPTFPVYSSKVKEIDGLAIKLEERFSASYLKLPQPKWWTTKLYGQSYYE